MKPFNERYLKAGEAVPVFKQKGLVVTETTGSSQEKEPKYSVLFTFEDMCPECQKSVANLLDKVRLDAKPATNKRGPAKRRNRKKKDEPKTEEYTEAKVVPEKTEPEPTPEPEKTEPEKEEPAAETKAKDASKENSGGNGADSEINEDNLIVDPATGDKYDKNTGEVVVRGKSAEAGGEKHPF